MKETVENVMVGKARSLNAWIRKKYLWWDDGANRNLHLAFMHGLNQESVMRDDIKKMKRGFLELT